MITSITPENSGILKTSTLGNEMSYEAPNNRSDLYVQKLNKNGESLWIHQPYGSFFESGDDVLAHNGAVYLTGYFEGSVDFDPGVATVMLNSIERSDAFIQKLSADGEHQWVSSWGGESLDSGEKLLIDPDGKIKVIGEYLGECYFTDEVILPKIIGGAGYILTVRPDGAWERVQQSFLTPQDAIFDQEGIPLFDFRIYHQEIRS